MKLGTGAPVALTAYPPVTSLGVFDRFIIYGTTSHFGLLIQLESVVG
jgi:hypothetical protein